MALTRAQWRAVVLDARADVEAKEDAAALAKTDAATSALAFNRAQTELREAQQALDALRTARRLLFAETDEG